MTCRLHDPARPDCAYCQPQLIDRPRFWYTTWRYTVDEVGVVEGTVLFLITIVVAGWSA